MDSNNGLERDTHNTKVILEIRLKKNLNGFRVNIEEGKPVL